MRKSNPLKVGDRVLLKNTTEYPNNEEIYGVAMTHYNSSTNLYDDGNNSEWIVHWYNSPRYHNNIKGGRGYYSEQELVKDNGFKKDNT